MLQLTHVKKHYDDFLALDVPVLGIEEGLWWLMGENGSGKTTFLKMIAGLHSFSGSIELNNKYGLHKQRNRFVKLVNYAEAEPLYPPFLTTADLVELYCETKGGDLLYAQDLLEKLHVFDQYRRQLGTLSSGMLKKVSLVLAFIGNPKWVLLDEPLITLDAEAVKTICVIIREFYSRGVSFIITSHQSILEQELAFTGMLEAKERTVIKAIHV